MRFKRSGEAEQIKARNPGEAYRQFLSIVLRKLDATIARVEGQDIGGPGAAYANADELIQDLRVIETRARGGQQPLARRQSGQAGAPRRRDFPLLHRQARSPREHHQDHRRACRRCGGRRPATATTARPSSAAANGASWLFRELARPLTGPRLIPQLPAEASELIDMFGQAAETQALARPRRLRLVHPVDDPLGRRHSRRLSARQGGRRISRCGRHRGLRAAHRAAVRDHRRSPRRAHDHARGAVGAADPPLHALAGRGAGGDDRLFGLEQGWRLRRLQLGARQGAVAVDQGRRRAGHPDRLLPWAWRLGLQRRRADRPRHRRPARRLDQGPLPRHRAGRGGLLQICQ